MRSMLYLLPLFLTIICLDLLAQNVNADCEIYCPVIDEWINTCTGCKNVVLADDCADVNALSLAQLDRFKIQSCKFTPDGVDELEGFCGEGTVISNNYWIGFRPRNSGKIHLNIEMLDCISSNQQCNGVQVALCRAFCTDPGNVFFSLEVLDCINCTDQTFDLISKDVIAGVPHYIMVDACCDDICEMLINVIDDDLLNPKIFMNSNEDLEVFIEGGQAPYTIVWDDGSYGPIFKNPEPNTLYTVSVKDSKKESNCLTSGTLNTNGNNTFDVVLSPPEVLVSCEFVSDSFTISALASGISNPSFEWLDREGIVLGNGPSYTGYFFDVVQVRVTNLDNGEQATKNILYSTSQENAQIELTEQYLSCNFKEIILPLHKFYQTTWYNFGGELVPNNTVSSPGVYNAIIVNPSNGCEFFQTIEILDQSPFVELIGTGVSCFGAMDGSIEIDIDVIGQSVTLEWMSSGLNIKDINLNALEAGVYSLTITDEQGCTANASVMIVEPEELSGTLNPSGTNLETSISGGTLPYNYLWNDGDTGANYNDALANTNYSVTVSDANGCELVLEGSILTSVFALEKTELKISCFPNPTGGLINVQTESKREWTYKLYNLQGQLLLTANANDHQANIDLTSLQAGLYYLYLEMEDGVYVEKVVKE